MVLRNSLFYLSLLTLVACTGSPAKIKLSETKAVPPGTQSTQDKPVYKMVCKTEIVTGTRFSKKICRTQEAWDELARRAKEQLEHGAKPQSNNRTGG